MLSLVTKTRSDAARVRAYFDALPPRARRELRKLRAAIRAAAPGAEEAFSYRIPAFRLNGRILVWYAAFREHCSLFPMGEGIRRANAAGLKRYRTAKGTIRFPLSEPVPEKLIERIAKYRATEIRKREKDARGTRK